MKFLKGKDIYFKSATYLAFVTLGAFVLSIPCFFFDLMGIPFGILLSGAIQVGAIYLLSYGQNKNLKFLVAIQISKTVIMLLIAFGIACLYHLANFKVFEPFSFLGTYLVLLIIYTIITGKEGKND